MKQVVGWMLVLAVVLAGCSASGSSAQSAAVDDEVLDKAVAVMDAAYGIVEALNSAWPDYAIKQAFTDFDIELNWFKKAGGPDQMPEFYSAISTWRSLLDEVGTTQSKYTESRQIDQLGEAMSAAEAELGAALDAAGR